MKNNKNRLIRDYILLAGLTFLLILIFIINSHFDYPFLYKDLVYISETDFGNDFILSNFRFTRSTSPVSFDISTSDIVLDMPDEPHKAFKNDLQDISLSIPTGILSVKNKLFEMNGRGNNYFLSFEIYFKNGSLYKSPTGIGWCNNYDKKIYFKNGNYYIFYSNDLRQIYKKSDKGLIPQLPKKTTLEVSGDLIYYREANAPLETFKMTGNDLYLINKMQDDFSNYIDFTYVDEQLISVKESTGQELLFKYSDNGFITQISIPNIQTYYFSYDAKGNLLKITNDKNTLFECEYKTLKKPHYLSMLNNGKNSFNIFYDPFGRVTDINSDGKRTHVKYSRTKIEIHKNNKLNLNIFTPQDKHIIISRLDDKRTAINYDKNGKMIYYSDNKHEFYYTLDPYGYLVEKKDSSGNITKFVYEKGIRSRLLLKKHKDIPVFIGKYNTKDDILIYKNDGQYTKIYDDFGEIKSIKKNGNPIVDISYDNLGNILKTTFPDDSSYIFKYDNKNNLYSFIDRFSLQYKLDYNEAYKIIGIHNPDGSYTDLFSSTLNKNNKDNIIEDFFISGKDGVHINFLKNEILLNNKFSGDFLLSLNNLRQLSKISVNNKYWQKMEYNKNGDLTSISDSKDKGLFFKRNKKGLLEKVMPSFDFPYYINYSKKGLISEIKHGKHTTLYSYDNENRIKNINLDNIITRYTYANDNISSITYPDTSQILFSYDKSGYLKTISFEKKSIADLKYNKNNNKIYIDFANGISEELIFNRDGYLNSHKILKKGVQNYHSTYIRKNGKMHIIDNNGLRTRFNYDENGNLVEYKQPEIDPVYISYLPNDNRISSYSFGSRNKIFKHLLLDDTALVFIKDSNDTTRISSLDFFGSIFGKGIDFIELNSMPAKISKNSFKVSKVTLNLDRDTSFYTDEVLMNKRSFFLKTYLKNGEKYSFKHNVNFALEMSRVIHFNELSYVDYVAKEGKITKIEWDDFQRIKSIRTAGDKAMIFSYNLNGTLHSTTYKNNTNILVYDIRGNLICITDSLGTPKFKIIYDYSRNLPIGFFDINNNFYSLHLDNNGSVKYVFDMRGKLTNSYIYGPYGNILKKKEKITLPVLFRGYFFIKKFNLLCDKDKFYDVSSFISFQPNEFYSEFDINYNLSFPEKHLFPGYSKRAINGAQQIKFDPYLNNGRTKQLSVPSELSWTNLLHNRNKSKLYFLFKMMP